VITVRDPERLELAAADIGARSTAITGAGFDIDGGRQFVAQPNDPIFRDPPGSDKFADPRR
jgi:hypothetical protein